MTNQEANNTGPNHAFLQARGSLANQRAMYFYQNDHLSAQISEQGHRCVLWAKETPTAQRGEEQAAKILKVDQASSVLGLPFETEAYSPYGFLKSEKVPALIAFNGQCLDMSTHTYVLGSGHRLFSPLRMRFNSPDGLSPFDRGGLNAYAYCENDPINFTDPSGQVRRGVQHAIHSRARAKNYTKDIHPTKLFNEKSNLKSQAKTLERGIKRDTGELFNLRKELPKLEQAAASAKRNNTKLVADPNDWADKRRVRAMNERNDLIAQKADGAFLAAKNHESFLSINITAQSDSLGVIKNKLKDIKDYVRKGS